MTMTIASPTVNSIRCVPVSFAGSSMCASPECAFATSVEPILEIAAGHCQPHPVQRLALHRPGEELPADGRQHGVGEDGVDHAPAALQLRAAAHDQLHR